MTKYKSKFTGQQIDDGIEYGVRVTQQTLSSAQKQQARENIGVTPEVQIGGNTPASDSGVKLFVDENSDDTVEVYTKAQATGQFMVVVNMNTEPTESTLTYTSTDGTTKSFKVSDEIRVPDAEADNGYTFYKLYALTTESNVTTATWDKLGAGGSSAAGLEIVAASGTTLTAEVGKYYRYDSDVNTLSITLPAITDSTKIETLIVYFKTGSSPALTITASAPSGGTAPIVYKQYMLIESGEKYEITFEWNGAFWSIYDTHLEEVSLKVINIQTTDVGGQTAAINITYNGNTVNRTWSTLNDGGTGTNHYDNGIISVYMDSGGYTYYVKAQTTVLYNNIVYKAGEQVASWAWNTTVNINIYYI